ncbi:unnamed protein product, partial [Oppiella nova]
HTYQTGYANLGNGQPAKLFSSWDKQTVDTHFKWMKENNIDTAALQRFGGHVKRDPIDTKSMNGVADNVRAAAEAHDRKFYIMWDISGWTNFSTELIEDYDNNIKRLVSSKAYAHQNGKPVVCIWGLGVSGRPNDTVGATALIAHLKKEGLYIAGGVGRQWRTDTTAFKDVYTKLDMLQPWAVGRMRNIKEAEDYKKTLEADHSLLTQHKIDFQPVLFPGFTWANWQDKAVRNQIPREHGDFMWRQFVNVRELDIPSCYVAMFDEYDEGTAIAKAAENKSMAPTEWFSRHREIQGLNEVLDENSGDPEAKEETQEVQTLDTEVDDRDRDETKGPEEMSGPEEGGESGVGEEVDREDSVDCEPIASTSRSGAKSVSNDRPFVCFWPNCGKRFTRKDHINRHKLYVHLNEKRFQCDYKGCGQRFVMNTDLNLHKRVHSGEKPFVCDVMDCDKRFAQKSNLNKHINAVHLKLKLFVCDEDNCGKKFNENASLIRHKRIHTGEKPYVCDHKDCGKRFTDPSHYRRHERKHLTNK